MPHTNRARRAEHYRSIDAYAANGEGGSGSKRKQAKGARRSAPNDEGPSYGDGASTDGRYGQRSVKVTHREPRPERGGRGGAAGGGRRSGGAVQATNSRGGKKNPSAKNRIRSLTRLLSKPGIDEEQQRRLKVLVEELEGKVSERAKNERERVLAIKYHKAKFFDRRKALRRLTQLHRKLQGEDLQDDQRKLFEDRQRDEENDLKYVLYFPKDKRYLPLNKGKEGAPRAKRSYERLLHEALARGQAAGWSEFQENLDKFVTGARGSARREGEGGDDVNDSDSDADSVASDQSSGSRPGAKRKRGAGLAGMRVMPQENIWDEEGDDGERMTAEGKEGKGNDGDVPHARLPAKGRKQHGSSTADEFARGEEGAGAARARSRSSEDENDSEDGGEERSESDLSGAEGFGAAASDEDEVFSFAEARRKWVAGAAAPGGGRGGGGGTGISSGDTGEEESASGGLDSKGGYDSDDSIGDIYERSPAVAAGEEKTTKVGSRGSRRLGQTPDESRNSSSNSNSSSSSSSSSADSSGGDAEDAADSDPSQRLPGGQASGAWDASSGSEEDEVSGSGSNSGEVALNDDFFLEEMGSDGETCENNASEDQIERRRQDQRHGGVSARRYGSGSGEGGRVMGRGRGGRSPRGRGTGRGGERNTSGRGRHSARGRWTGRGSGAKPPGGDEREGWRGWGLFRGGRVGPPRGRGPRLPANGGGGRGRGAAGSNRGGRGRTGDGSSRPNKITRFDDD